MRVENCGLARPRSLTASAAFVASLRSECRRRCSKNSRLWTKLLRLRAKFWRTSWTPPPSSKRVELRLRRNLRSRRSSCLANGRLVTSSSDSTSVAACSLSVSRRQKCVERSSGVAFADQVDTGEQQLENVTSTAIVFHETLAQTAVELVELVANAPEVPGELLRQADDLASTLQRPFVG